MNDILTQRITNIAIAGDIAADLITAFGPRGDTFNLNIPEGMAARLWDFSVFFQWGQDSRYGVNLMRTSTGPDGVRAWTNDDEVLQDGGQLAALMFKNDVVTSGFWGNYSRDTEHLWDMDYRVVMDPRVAGFAQTTMQMSFRLRYKLVRASRAEVAAILFWQNEGVKRA